jgi:ribosome-associated protein
VIADLPLPELRWAIEAAQNKKASDVTVLDLRALATFTDYFLVCSGWSAPQIQAIADEIEKQLRSHGRTLAHREGYDSAEWVLLDYGAFVVHIFGEKARLFYDLERLWRAARRIDVPELGASGQPSASSSR